MRAIAIMNNKGGVGKTTTAIAMADILTRDYKKRVLLVDCDGQCNLTEFFLPDFDPDQSLTLHHILTGTGEPLWSDNPLPISKDLWLIPGSPELYTEDLEAVMEGQDQAKTRRVADFVGCVRKDDGADFVIFDCPPGFTAASLAALQPQRLLLVTKWLYPQVAREFGTTWYAVERNIRTAVTIAWTANPALLETLAQTREKKA